MKEIFALIWKDVRVLKTDRLGLTLTFVVPFFMMLMFGYIFGGMGGKAGPIRIIGIDHSETPVGKRLIRALEAESSLNVLTSYSTEEQPGRQLAFGDSVAALWVKTGKVPAALIIPAGALSDTSFGLRLVLLYDPRNEIETQMLQGVLQKAIMTRIPSLFPMLMQRSAMKHLGIDGGRAFNNEIASAVGRYFDIPVDSIAGWSGVLDTVTSMEDTASEGMSFFSDLVTFDRQQLVGERVLNPMVTRSIGGWAVMFLLFSLTAAAASLLEEREGGTLHRLLTAPLSRGRILLSKFGYSWFLGIVQLLVLFVASALVFQVDIYGNFGNLLIMVLTASAAATSFGMLVASVVRSSAQANGLATVLILTMSALGGSWFPVTLMPEFIQGISRFTITYWAVEGFLNILWRDFSFLQLLQSYAILAGIALGLTSIALVIVHRRAVI